VVVDGANQSVVTTANAIPPSSKPIIKQRMNEHFPPPILSEYSALKITKKNIFTKSENRYLTIK